MYAFFFFFISIRTIKTSVETFKKKLQFLPIPVSNFPLFRHTRCAFSRLRCNGHNLLLSSHLSRIGKIENPSCSACGHSSQDTSADTRLRTPLWILVPGDLCGYSSKDTSAYTRPRTLALWRLSVSLRPLVQPWGVARLLGLHGLLPCPHPSEGSGNNNNNFPRKMTSCFKLKFENCLLLLPFSYNRNRPEK